MIELRVPGDKSITHRSLMLGALAQGRSTIRGALVAGDTRSTAAALSALGCTIPELTEQAFSIEGVGLRGLQMPESTLDCGNSGTTVRLMMGIVAGADLAATFDGDESLRTRPMARISEPLQQMGAQVEWLGAPGRLPLRLRAGAHGLREIEYHSPHASAQIKSALLLAGLVAGVHVRVIEPYTSRDHSERMLRAVGVRVEETTDPAGGQHIVDLEPREVTFPLELEVPGDISSAAFLLAAATLGVTDALRVRNVGLNPTRSGFLEVVRQMGGTLRVENERVQGGELVGDLVAEPSDLHAVEMGGALIPRLIDEIPILAMLAARAKGRTVIRDAAELRVKESDRLRMVAANLAAIGVRVEELSDGLIIEGNSKALSGRVATALDHRIAMSFGVLAAQSGNAIVLDDPDIVKISFPEFWEVLDDYRT